MIPVVWFDASKGNWDMGIFQLTFEKYPDLFPQYNEKINPPFERAIVMCVGKPDVIKLKRYLEKIKSGVVIFASEEDAYYPWKEVMHSGLEAWCQYWHPSTKSEIKQENRILLGTPYRIKDYDTTPLEKQYLWSFIGQNQNPFRQQAVSAMMDLLGTSDGYLQVISGFGGYCDDGVLYQNYLDIMRQSKFVICPAGSMCVDSFRLYEAIECGAIPITDIRAPRDPHGFNYWSEVYPLNGLDYVTAWDADLLISMMNLERDQAVPLDHNGEVFTGSVSHYWWWRYKRELEQKLLNLAQ